MIRPGGMSDNMPEMTLGRGQSFVTWSSPQLALRAGAPAVASFNVPFEVVANVSNPGDQAATNVRVEAQIPPGARVTGADSFATVTDRAVIWEIGTIAPQTQLDLFMTVATPQSIVLPFLATGDGLRREDTVRVDVFQPALKLQVQPQRERYEAGQPVTFNIAVTNDSDRPLQDVYLTARGDEGMTFQDGTRGKRLDQKKVGGPGEVGLETGGGGFRQVDPGVLGDRRRQLAQIVEGPGRALRIARRDLRRHQPQAIVEVVGEVVAELAVDFDRRRPVAGRLAVAALDRQPVLARQRRGQLEGALGGFRRPLAVAFDLPGLRQRGLDQGVLSRIPLGEPVNQGDVLAFTIDREHVLVFESNAA